MSEKKIPIVELFGPTLQGEGALAGQVSFFVRSGGCGYRCKWCDSMHAVDPKQIKKGAAYLEPEEIVAKIVGLAGEDQPKRPWVTLTGGDPCLWDFSKVIAGLHLEGFRVGVETQGELWQDWLEGCDLVTCSPKGPSSGMDSKFSIEMLQKYAVRLCSWRDPDLRHRLALKFVIFTKEDLEWASRMRKLAPDARLFLSAGTPLVKDNIATHILLSYRWLTDQVLQRPEFADATVLPQLHALLWGRELGR